MIDKKTVYKITSQIPRGKVATYGIIAKLSGTASPRAVGGLLHKNPDPKKIPCHRVVNSKGEVAENFAFGGKRGQIERLRREGVEINGGGLDLTKHLWHPNQLFLMYTGLLKKYGEPGPWPWWGQGKPHHREEIAFGAILTQNTSWRNVEKALENLKKEKVCTIRGIYKMGEADCHKLKTLIRPAGFYNQKADYLYGFCKYVVENAKSLENFFKSPVDVARERLLNLRGIGKETADTILLYVGDKPVFVIDAYTKRFVEKHKLKTNLNYDDLQNFFTKNLPQEVDFYQDFHALIVRWAKDK